MDKKEFADRVHAMQERLYRLAYGQLREEQDRRDAVQEAILKAWQSRERLRDEAYFETWLVRILINECHNIQRAGRRIFPVERLPEQPYVEENMEGSDEELREAILALPMKLRLPVMLHYIEGYTTEEAGRILHVPVGTVRSRLKKARELMKAELDGKEDNE